MGFLTGRGNSATAVLSCAMPHQAVVFPIHLLTDCHICLSVFSAIAAGMLAMLWDGCPQRCVILAHGGADVRLVQVVPEASSYADLGPCFKVA